MRFPARSMWLLLRCRRKKMKSKQHCKGFLICVCACHEREHQQELLLLKGVAIAANNERVREVPAC